MILVLVLFLSFPTFPNAHSFFQRNSNDRAGDPPSTVRHRRERKERRTPPTGGAPSPSYFKKELIGYGVGRLTKKKENISFCNRIAEEIRNRISIGQEIDRIIVRGYADSIRIRNQGIKYDFRLLPLKCQREVASGPIDNPKLAYLRGCIVWNSLSGILESNYADGIKIAWTKTGVDYRDAKKRGRMFRKVVVEVFWR